MLESSTLHSISRGIIFHLRVSGFGSIVVFRRFACQSAIDVDISRIYPSWDSSRQAACPFPHWLGSVSQLLTESPFMGDGAKPNRQAKTETPATIFPEIEAGRTSQVSALGATRRGNRERRAISPGKLFLAPISSSSQSPRTPDKNTRKRRARLAAGQGARRQSAER